MAFLTWLHCTALQRCGQKTKPHQIVMVLFSACYNEVFYSVLLVETCGFTEGVTA